MPSFLKVRIISARNLPVMDRTTELTDAFVEVKFADLESKKTPICRKTLNPIWNEDFRFEVVDDSALQNEPLEIKIMDYDQITYNEAIGTVLIDLNPLLTMDSNSQVSGWFPIYDTLNGIRGELNAQIKLQFFGNMNPFKDSSAGVQFFSAPVVPTGFFVEKVLGFVTALDNEDDPEFHWTDSFRTPRKSNESRTRVMYQLSGTIRRILGRKVLELNGNAVLGFKQNFDVEEDEKSIVCRAIGTAVKLGRTGTSVPSSIPATPSFSAKESVTFMSPTMLPSLEKKMSVRETDDLIEEDELAELSQPMLPMPSSTRIQDPILLTLTKYPEHVIIGTGGFVCAASIKVLDNDSKEVRESWWNEAREEVKSHAKTLSCSHVIGYTEQESIVDEVVFLYCSGTAVNLDLNAIQLVTTKDLLQKVSASSLIQSPLSTSNSNLHSIQQEKAIDEAMNQTSPSKKKKKPVCRSCHITYKKGESPFPMALARCRGCGKKHVPEVILSTTEPPSELETIGSWVLMEAHVCRAKKIKVGESKSTSVSESIPFAQYDIHRQLMYKLRIYGLNAVYGLKIQFTIGENIITAVATGTAFYVKALPAPPPLKMRRTLEVVDAEDELLLETQRRLMAKSEMNRKKIEEILSEGGVTDIMTSFESGLDDASSSDSSSEEEIDPNDPIEKSRLQQRAMVIEIDDEQDEDLVLFLEDVWNEKFQLCNIEMPVNFKDELSNSQMITIVKQRLIDPSHHPNRQLANIFKSMYQDLAFQMSFLSPCSVTGVSYTVKIPKPNLVQVFMTAMAHGKLLEQANVDYSPSGEPSFQDDAVLEQVTPQSYYTFPRLSSILGNRLSQSISIPQYSNFASSYQDPEESFTSSDDEDSDIDPESAVSRHSIPNMSSFRRSSTKEAEFNPVEITPLTTVPNSSHAQYLGRISLHFIKESNLMYDSLLGSSGMGEFTHVFLMELLAIVKAHVICLGGNAVVSFSIDQIHFTESLKNQGYAMVSVSGDVVQVAYLESRNLDQLSTNIFSPQ